MEMQTEGSENQLHSSRASRPRPPAVAKKPKPILPKKPVIAVKPSVHQSNTQNGTISKPSDTTTNTPNITDEATTATDPAPKPKGPPPTLPKTSPRGTPPTIPKSQIRGNVIPKPGSKNSSPVREAVEAVPESADDEPERGEHHNKTPPPLPRTPPQGRVISKSALKESSPVRQPSNRPSRTPPPLPKDPPRGKATSKSVPNQCSKDSDESPRGTPGNSRETSPVKDVVSNGLKSLSGSQESVNPEIHKCSSDANTESVSPEHSTHGDTLEDLSEKVPDTDSESHDICANNNKSTESIPGTIDCSRIESAESVNVPNTNISKPENVCDKETVAIDSPGKILENTSKEDFKFSSLKSKFLNCEKKSPPTPAKPRPRKTDKIKSVNTEKGSPDSSTGQSENLPSSTHSDKGKPKSKWFVDREKGSVKQDKQNSEFQVKFIKGDDDAAVQFSTHSDSPVSFEEEQTKEESSSELPTKTDIKDACDSNTCAISDTTDKDITASVNDEAVVSSEVSKSVDSKEGGISPSNSFNISTSHPTPVPRKSAPIPKPRPVPRKRLSLNRLSGTEETFASGIDFSNVQSSEAVNSPLSKSQSEESVFKNDNELKISPMKGFSVDDVSVTISAKSEHSAVAEATGNYILQDKEKIKVVDQPLKVKSLVKSRVVYNEKGEEKQYRVIDKSIASPSKCDKSIKDADKQIDKTVSRTKADNNTESSSVPGVCVSNDNAVNEYATADSEINKRTDTTVPNIHVESKPDDKESPKSNDSFEDLLGDKAILEPSSLLTEIEEILSRSFKTSSLTRSGSSPEKKVSPFLNTKSLRPERSRSVDTNPENAPIRPPRPKKEQKKLRSQSQVVYDSCGSDTESLPDLSKGKMTLTPTGLGPDKCATLGPAKPHPPKPKRHKLLKVQRSQSDVSAMKSIIDTKEDRSPAQHHRRQASDAGPYMERPLSCGGQTPETVRPTSWRKSRPSRRAPDPPSIPAYDQSVSSPTIDLNYVVPLDSRVKSMSGGPSKPRRRSDTEHQAMEYIGKKGAPRSVYSSINGDDAGDSSDDDHDYHEISDEISQSKVNASLEASPKTVASMAKPTKSSRGRPLRTPPKLPPRNSNASHSFETASVSSTGQEFDSAVTGGVSSMEDVSISSGFDTEGSVISKDVASPAGYKGFSKHVLYPGTSSPYVQGLASSEKDVTQSGQGLNSSLSSGSDGYINHRPVSGSSFQYDSGSSSQMAGQISSSDSEEDSEEKSNRKKAKKCFQIAQEVMSSERVFVDVLVLLNVDFRRQISQATEAAGRPVIPSEVLNRILDYLPQLQNFNENLLLDLEERLSKWGEKKGIADIFVKKGPFLKLYSMYIRDFETMTATLDDACKKYPAFLAAVKEFEMSERCASLALKHYMLKPIQRIPQYRLLLQDYLKHLPENSPELKDMETALAIVSEVAHHANENMRHTDYVQKMLEIQRSLIGQFEVVKPGRLFLKEGELMKLSRKEMQPRYFFLFNDVLLYTTPVATGYRLNNVLPLAGMKVSMSAQDEYKMEFSIISVQRSFTLQGSTLEERDDWVTALNSAIDENAKKRNTFEAVRAGAQVLLDKDFVLGHKAPLWIPDARVTMCMLCTGEFTVTWRRHHCRACGRVVCGNCSDNKAPLRYKKYQPNRVCDECFKTLKEEAEKDRVKDSELDSGSVAESEEGLSIHSITNNLMERFTKIRRSGRVEKKSRPDRLKEVRANDEEASMSGYLHRMYKGKKWKKKWFLIKEKVLYTFKATQDTAAADSMVLLGYEVSRFSEYFEGTEPELLFQLSHPNTEPIVFRTDSATATEKWVQVMREAIVA